MKVLETETVEQEFVKDILCNRCGMSCKVAPIGSFEVASCVESWGFWSKKDTFEAEWHLCEDCCDAVTKDFKIPVRRGSYLFVDMGEEEG